MKTLSAWGMIDLADDQNLSAYGRLEPTRDEIAAAEAAWNAPPPEYVKRGGEPTPATLLPPVSGKNLGLLSAVGRLVNADIAAAGGAPVDLPTLWRVILRSEGPEVLVVALHLACVRLVASGAARSDDERLVRLLAIRVAETAPALPPTIGTQRGTDDGS